MDKMELLELVNKRDMKIHEKINKNLMEALEEEFVMTNVTRRYLNYLMKSNSLGSLQNSDANELMSKNTIPIKKILGFDISKHDIKCPMYLHKHTYLELDYVYQGSCSYYIDNENTVFQLKEKQICIVNQNIVHGIKVHSNEDIIFKCMIPFDSVDLNQYKEIDKDNILKKFLIYALNEDMAHASYIVFNVEDSHLVDEIMYRFFSEFVIKSPGWKQAIDNHLSNLFIDLMRIPVSRSRMVTDISEEKLNITKVITCIKKNYQYISLKDIANDLHFHENYLSRMIKKHTNQSFRELLSQIRLKEAEKLLLNTDLTVAEIATKLGYLKPNYFYKLFKDNYGVTPMEFKSKCTS